MKQCTKCLTCLTADTTNFQQIKKGGKERLSAECRSCRKQRYRLWYSANREYCIQRSTESIKARRKKPAFKEKEKILTRLRKREMLKCPAKREFHKQQINEWFKNNREKVRQMPSRNKGILCAYQSARRAAELKATPPWADMAAIKEKYIKASALTHETGVPHEVDHIYPLRGVNICGLHIAENLQVIHRKKNRQKSNLLIQQEN